MMKECSYKKTHTQKHNKNSIKTLKKHTQKHMHIYRLGDGGGRRTKAESLVPKYLWYGDFMDKSSL